jgi:hypothetical protein
MKRCLNTTLLFIGIVFPSFQTYAIAQRNAPPAEPSQSGMSARIPGISSYFPLEVGNEWVYSNGINRFEIHVLAETREGNGRKYFEVSNFFQPYDYVETHKIRYGSLGQILEFNPNGEDFLWYDFGNLRSEWRVQTSNSIMCLTDSRAIPEGTSETVSVPAGAFENALYLDFSSRCVDAGFEKEYFAQGVGLVQRILDNIGGWDIYNLVSARVGSRILPAISYGIEVSMDNPVYYNNRMPPVRNPWPTAHVLILARNSTATPVTLAFLTSQRFDFIVRDTSGKEVLRWSDGKVFEQVTGQETLVKGSRRYGAEIVLKTRGGEALPSGFYTLTGYLTIQGWESGSPCLLGTVPFEIRNLQ